VVAEQRRHCPQIDDSLQIARDRTPLYYRLCVHEKTNLGWALLCFADGQRRGVTGTLGAMQLQALCDFVSHVDAPETRLQQIGEGPKKTAT
jgi:hypothetical protein